MKAINQAKKVEEALGQAVVTGEELKSSLQRESARGDQASARVLNYHLLSAFTQKASYA